MKPGRGRPVSGFAGLLVCVALCNSLIGCVQAEEEYKIYKGYSLIRAVPSTSAQVNALADLIDRELEGVQVWKEPRGELSPVDLLVSEKSRGQVVGELDQHKIVYTVKEDHVERLLEQHRRLKRSEPLNGPSNFSFDVYHTYEEIMDWLDMKGRTCGDRCKVFNIGKTYEQRTLKVIKIGRKSNKPVIWLDAGIHAREWVAPATALCLINKLLDENDADGRYLLSRFRFVALPLINADGYAYTWSRDRMWRKTRSQHSNSQTSCVGTDPNRNFGYKWGGLGASKNPCSESYRGPSAFSEVETRTMSDYMLNLTREDNVPVYISLHSYGQYFLTSWGYSSAVPSDFNELIAVAKQATIDMEKVEGFVYEYGSAGRLLYAASGGSDDWAKGTAGIKYSYTIELRDTGDYGFLLPPQHILPTCRETLAGLRAVARSVHRARRRRLRKLRNLRLH